MYYHGDYVYMNAYMLVFYALQYVIQKKQMDFNQIYLQNNKTGDKLWSVEYYHLWSFNGYLSPARVINR